MTILGLRTATDLQLAQLVLKRMVLASGSVWRHGLAGVQRSRQHAASTSSPERDRSVKRFPGLGIAAALASTAALAHAGLPAWWCLPLAVAAVLGLALRRETIAETPWPASALDEVGAECDDRGCRRTSSEVFAQRWLRARPHGHPGNDLKRGEDMKTPWVVILCKFNNGDDEPFPKHYYEDLFTADDTGSPWNMIRYFNDCSHGTLDLTGTQVFGWYNLDKSVDDYNALGSGARDALIGWARDAAVAHGVDLNPFFRTAVCTNRWQDIGAAPSLSGLVAQGPLTPFPCGLGHEMGHCYGLMHSRVDGSDVDYMDPWDIMSAFNDYSTPDPEFKLIGPVLNAWNMRSRGWLDESRVWKGSGNGFDETITLRPLVRRDLPGLLAAELPGGYLIEFRAPDGWDAGIPRAAVLVHRFEGGHSYLMAGNSGSHDLIAGDSFGDDDPGGLPPITFSEFDRLDVVSIDPAGQTATIRLRHHSPIHLAVDGRAIDPMYLILSGSAYLRWVEQHHPHEPKVAEIRAALHEMPPEERRAATHRAKTLVRLGQAVEEASSGAD